MAEETKKEVANEEEIISDEELDMVAGGAGLRMTKKVQTVDISEDTLSKI